MHTRSLVRWLGYARKLSGLAEENARYAVPLRLRIIRTRREVKDSTSSFLGAAAEQNNLLMVACPALSAARPAFVQRCFPSIFCRFLPVRTPTERINVRGGGSLIQLPFATVHG